MQSDQTPASASPPKSDDQYGLPLAQAITVFVPPDLLKRADAARAAWKAAGSPRAPNNLPHMLAGGDRTLVREPHPAVAELGNAWVACAEALRHSLRFAELEAHKCNDLVAGTWEPVRPEAWDVLKINVIGSTLYTDAVPTLFVSFDRRQRPRVRVRRILTDRAEAPAYVTNMPPAFPAESDPAAPMVTNSETTISPKPRRAGGGYRAADDPLVEEIHRLRKADKDLSVHAAARMVAGGAAGTLEESNRARRLEKRYKERHPNWRR